MVPVVLVSYVSCALAEERNNHILASFDHAISLRVTNAGCDVVDVTARAQCFHLGINVFGAKVCYQYFWAAKIGDD